MKTIRIVTPTGHLGTTPLEKASFERGCVASPDFIVADSGSAGKNLFYARLPDVKGTAGTAAIMSDEVLHARPAYEWTLNHVIEVADPLELFRTRSETIQSRDPETRP